MTYIRDIYEYINSIAPYSLQEGYDNSGINVCFNDTPISRVLIALDITNEVIDEAVSKNAQLILTHHPVIFRGIKLLDSQSAAARLCMAGISALSAHTNFDSAVMNRVLCDKLGLTPDDTPLALEGSTPIGCICNISGGIAADELAQRIKNALGCTALRYNREKERIYSAAVCSGSGGSLLKDALAKGADALITGDVKHDVFIDAHNAGFTVFDAGHFHTENIFCEYMQKELSAKFAEVEFIAAQSSRDILSYVFQG